jgi:hypothetical protein|tara:strand:+ start:4140 stop:4364 length:225 start_codon:yes stop_codon:yes gene_type:complete
MVILMLGGNSKDRLEVNSTIALNVHLVERVKMTEGVLEWVDSWQDVRETDIAKVGELLRQGGLNRPGFTGDSVV